jgi:hypothetical protein
VFSNDRQNLWFDHGPVQSFFLGDADEVGSVEYARDTANLEELAREWRICCVSDAREVHGLAGVAGNWFTRDELQT